MLLSDASLASTSVQDVASTAAYNVVRDSVFGALLLVAVVLCVWLVKRVLEVQDLRVADQKHMSERLEKAQDRQGTLIEKTTEAFSSFRGSIDQLNRTQETHRDADYELASVIQRLQGTVDSVIRDAVRGKRTGLSGEYNATRIIHDPPDKPVKG